MTDPVEADRLRRARDDRRIVRCKGCGAWIWLPTFKEDPCPVCDTLARGGWTITPVQ